MTIPFLATPRGIYSFGYAILDIVQADNKTSLKTIAERVNLSTTDD